MYFYLLHQCNIRRWINPFEFKTRDLEFMLGSTRATIVAIRNKLKQRGLIDFAKGIGSGSAAYLICGAKVTDKELAKRFCVQLENTKLNTNGICVQSENTMLNTTLNTMLNTTLNTNGNPTLLREERRKKKKDTIPPKGASVHNADGCLFPGKDSGKTKGVKASRLAGFSPPTPDEVRTYFAMRGADLGLPDWETEADAFFCYFDSQGWVKSNGRKVASWESLANDWILRKKRELKQQESNENSTANRGDTPDGRLACEQSKLAGRIMQRCRTRGDGSDTELPF